MKKEQFKHNLKKAKRQQETERLTKEQGNNKRQAEALSSIFKHFNT